MARGLPPRALARVAFVVACASPAMALASVVQPGTPSPITPVDVALATLPDERPPAPDLLATEFDAPPIVPGVNHAFGLESQNDAQRVPLDYFLESIADLGRPERWDSRDGSNPAARFPVDNADRLDPSIEDAMIARMRRHFANEERFWAESAHELFEMARMIGADPVGRDIRVNTRRLANQAREQKRRLDRALRDAAPTIERHLARLEDPDETERERRRLLAITAELGARLDAHERREPDADPLRAALWSMLSERQRTIVSDGIVRRYLARRLERDGMTPEEIRRALLDARPNARPDAAMGEIASGERAMTTAPDGSSTRESGPHAGTDAGTDIEADIEADDTGMTANPMMSAMARVDLGTMGGRPEPLTRQQILRGDIDDTLMTEAQRERYLEQHPGALEQRLRELRQRAVRRAFGTDRDRHLSRPAPPSVAEALRGVDWFEDTRADP